MFNNPPLILAHQKSCQHGNFVTPDKIIVHNSNGYEVKSRDCPHRGYMMHEPGDVVKNIECKLHGFCWNNQGEPTNDHFYKLAHHGEATLGRSGLLFQNFVEPDHEWVNRLAAETELQYVKSYSGRSNGSWLWLMDLNSDLLHFRENGVHPRQSLETPLDTLQIDKGDGWCLQINATGFWLFVFPFTAIEYEPGKLSVNRVVPNDINNEYGFTWHTQLYYSSDVDSSQRHIWEKLIDVYLEDIKAIENIRRPFFPLKRGVNHWEDHVLHWAQWYNQHVKIK